MPPTKAPGPNPPRAAWRGFPDAILLAPERETLAHPRYAAAKSGDASEAARLVHALVDPTDLASVTGRILGSARHSHVLACAHAYERDGYNAIPAALAQLVSELSGIAFDTSLVQTNIVWHTGSDGYGRLARQAAFGGHVIPKRSYIVVDDFIGQGGTVANLRGWIESSGATVVQAIALTGKPYSARLNPTPEQLHELRTRHGAEFENWWVQRFGHAFDCLTQSEARYLARSPDVDTIRSRLAAALRTGDSGGDA